MCRFRHPAPQRLALHLIGIGLVLLALGAAAAPGRKQEPEAIRWDESRTGCTFSRGPDGKYRYGIWSGDEGVALSVDAQEVEKVRRRHEPFFSVLLNFTYRGKDAMDIPAQNISLEFVKHFKVTLQALDPDRFSERIQADADAFDHETAREIERHPEKKDAKEANARIFQKDAAELIEFVTKNSLRPARLDPANNQAAGWIFFSADNKWISGWKKQEEFVLRVPLEGKVFEFPFKLPPKEGELVLRQRESSGSTK
jgi:hypothetical protein